MSLLCLVLQTVSGVQQTRSGDFGLKQCFYVPASTAHVVRLSCFLQYFMKITCNCCIWYIVTDSSYKRRPPDGDDRQHMRGSLECEDSFLSCRVLQLNVHVFFLLNNFNLRNHKAAKPLRVWVLLQWLIKHNLRTT